MSSKVNQMKMIMSTRAAATLLLAVTSAVSAQEGASSTNQESAAATVKSESFMRFKGTDLHIGKLPPITFHGFLSQGFLASDTYDYLGNSTEGSFQFTEAAVSASMSPFARTRISAQAFLFDVGSSGEYQPALDYAVIDYSLRNEIGFRGGRIRRPMGIYNAIQDIDLTRTSILLPQGMYDARYRDFLASVDGGSIYGDISLKKAGGISYEMYGGMVNLSEEGGVARLVQDSLRNPPTEYVGVNGFIMAGAQLWWNTPVDGLRAGAAFAYAFEVSYDYRLNIPPAFGGGDYHAVLNIPVQHYSLEYQWKSWTFQAEYQTLVFKTHTEHNGNSTPTTSVGADTWYVGAAYRVNKWFEVGTYYTENYADMSDRSGKSFAVSSDAYQKDVALSFRFDPKPWWVIKIEGHAIRGTALLHDTKNNPTRDSDAWFMFAAKTTFSF